MSNVKSPACRHVLRAVLIALLAVCGMMAAASFPAAPVYAASNFVIEDYDINMEVFEDDTYLITETLDVRFTAPSHGIYRTIPYRTELYRDGQRSSFYGRVRDFQMLSGQPVDKSRGQTDYSFKIGDPDQYADEETTYKFSYIFDMRGDHLKDADEVYYNVIGTSWEAKSIDHVSFTVTFPKDIDPDNVGVRTGWQTDIPFESDGKRVIRGETTEDTLDGLTIRAVLPEGYFNKQASSSNLLFYLLIAIMAAITAGGFLMWRRYGRDPEIIETEEFYPPEGLSAPEVAYLEAGSVEGSKVTSMLLSLADKGYLKIQEFQEPYGIRKKKTRASYRIIQQKSYDGDSEDEQIFMDGLFDDGARSSVEMSDLKDSFYKTVGEIKKNIEARYEDRLWDQRANTCGRTLRLIGCLGAIALYVIAKALNGSPFFAGGEDFMFLIVFGVMQFVLPPIGYYGITRWINKPDKKVGKFILGLIGWSILIVIGLGLALLFDTCMGAQIIPYLLGHVMIFLLFLMGALCERMTDEYAELLGKIRGYKRFLNVAEKERMEMLAEQDPNYFYKNLAFAYALGVTAVYAKRFAPLAQEPPQWYDAPYYTTGHMGVADGHSFDAGSLMSSMDSMMSSVSSSMTSSPSDSGGGGSFSGGGGAGGGGGGSW